MKKDIQEYIRAKVENAVENALALDIVEIAEMLDLNADEVAWARDHLGIRVVILGGEHDPYG